MTLATLRGSEKQVAWAEDIRRGQLRLLETYKESIKERIEREGATEIFLWVLGEYEKAEAKLREETSAKIWIENRNIVKLLDASITKRAMQIQNPDGTIKK